MLVCNHFIGAASETKVTVQYVWSMYVIPCLMYVFIECYKNNVKGRGFIWNSVGKLIFSDLNVRTCALTLYVASHSGRKDGLASGTRAAEKYTACFFCIHDMSELPSHQ